jgi:hypothetical protein
VIRRYAPFVAEVGVASPENDRERRERAFLGYEPWL